MVYTRGRKKRGEAADDAQDPAPAVAPLLATRVQPTCGRPKKKTIDPTSANTNGAANEKPSSPPPVEPLSNVSKANGLSHGLKRNGLSNGYQPNGKQTQNGCKSRRAENEEEAEGQEPEVVQEKDNSGANGLIEVEENMAEPEEKGYTSLMAPWILDTMDLDEGASDKEVQSTANGNGNGNYLSVAVTAKNDFERTPTKSSKTDKRSNGNGAATPSRLLRKDTLRQTASPTIRKETRDTPVSSRRNKKHVHFSDETVSNVMKPNGGATGKENKVDEPDIEMGGTSSGLDIPIENNFQPKAHNTTVDPKRPSRASTAAESVDLSAHMWKVEEYRKERAKDDEPILEELRYFLLNTTSETPKASGSPNGMTGSPSGIVKSPNGITLSPNGVRGFPNGIAKSANGIMPSPTLVIESLNGIIESIRWDDGTRSPRSDSPRAESSRSQTGKTLKSCKYLKAPPNSRSGMYGHNSPVKLQLMECQPQLTPTKCLSPTAEPDYYPPASPGSPAISLSSASSVGSDFEISDKTWDETLNEHEKFNDTMLTGFDSAFKRTTALRSAIRSQAKRIGSLYDTIKLVGAVSATKFNNRPTKPDNEHAATSDEKGEQEDATCAKGIQNQIAAAEEDHFKQHREVVGHLLGHVLGDTDIEELTMQHHTDFEELTTMQNSGMRGKEMALFTEECMHTAMDILAFTEGEEKSDEDDERKRQQKIKDLEFMRRINEAYLKAPRNVLMDGEDDYDGQEQDETAEAKMMRRFVQEEEL